MNDSCGDNGAVTESFWRLEDTCASNGVVVAFFVMVTIAFGLPWNILVVITTIKEKLYHQPTVVLLLSLALADLYLFFPMLLVMITGFSKEFIFGTSDRFRCYVCHVTSVDMIASLYHSLLIVAMMSLDRLLYIGKPLQYERLVTPKLMWAAVLATALISVAIGFSALSRGFHGPFLKDYLVCFTPISIPYVSSLTVIGTFIVTVTLICNLWFFVIVLRNIKAVYGDKDDMDTNSNLIIWACCRVKTDTTAHHKQNRLFLVVGALVFSTMFTWLPFIVVIQRVYQSVVEQCSGMEFITVVLVYSQPAVHIVIETLLIPDVRKPLFRMFRKFW